MAHMSIALGHAADRRLEWRKRLEVSGVNLRAPIYRVLFCEFKVLPCRLFGVQINDDWRMSTRLDEAHKFVGT